MCVFVCICQVEDQISTIEVCNITNNNKDHNQGEDCACLSVHADGSVSVQCGHINPQPAGVALYLSFRDTVEE